MKFLRQRRASLPGNQQEETVSERILWAKLSVHPPNMSNIHISSLRLYWPLHSPCQPQIYLFQAFPAFPSPFAVLIPASPHTCCPSCEPPLPPASCPVTWSQVISKRCEEVQPEGRWWPTHTWSEVSEGYNGNGKRKCHSSRGKHRGSTTARQPAEFDPQSLFSHTFYCSSPSFFLLPLSTFITLTLLFLLCFPSVCLIKSCFGIQPDPSVFHGHRLCSVSLLTQTDQPRLFSSAVSVEQLSVVTQLWLHKNIHSRNSIRLRSESSESNDSDTIDPGLQGTEMCTGADFQGGTDYSNVQRANENVTLKFLRQFVSPPVSHCDLMQRLLHHFSARSRTKGNVEPEAVCCVVV